MTFLPRMVGLISEKEVPLYGIRQLSISGEKLSANASEVIEFKSTYFSSNFQLQLPSAANKSVNNALQL